MKKRVFIIHGWSGHPGEGWLLWLENTLKNSGYEVLAPQMPNTDKPRIDEWVNFLDKLVDKPNKNTFFVGHSIGCQTIVRYLEKIYGKVGGAVFVAGWFDLIGLETEEEKIIAKPWIESPINFEKVKKTTNNYLVILSDNDPVVELASNKKIFEEKLGAKVIVKKEAEHFNEVATIPEIVEFIQDKQRAGAP
jgi:predicted alpha/beta hydrolase family esterase